MAWDAHKHTNPHNPAMTWTLDTRLKAGLVVLGPGSSILVVLYRETGPAWDPVLVLFLQHALDVRLHT